MKKLLLTLSGLAMVAPALSMAHCTVFDVYAADAEWKNAIDSNDADDVVDLYAQDGVLIPTFGVIIIDNQIDRFEYFTKLFHEVQNLSVNFDYPTRHVQFIDGGAVSSGFYTFEGESDEGHVEVPARYTFVYKKHHHDEGDTGCNLQLITHHSSEQPFSSTITQLIEQSTI